MDQNGFELSFPATEVEASAGIAALAEQLSEQGLPEAHAGDVRIALAEAINNVVEHAYIGVEAAQVQVNCALRANWLEIRISDTGLPLPDRQPPEGIPASVETELQDLPEGGFGWFLIRRLASDIRYERREGFNHLFLRFDLLSSSNG
ncbi:MAG: ATP-binding protein [Ruegeria sp.]|uniref:ATP-binding protein n=1 Tax=Ruegeria sp. TaxID=1879320 RepID=UPI00349E902C